MADFGYNRRKTIAVPVGNVEVGGNNPVVLQSMTNTSTLDTPGSVAQIERIVDAGANIVRLTAQGKKEAANLAEIRKQLRDKGVDVPLVADIHFNPGAALVAAANVEKVRINPGNYVDPGRVFKKIDFTDEEYLEEIKKIDEALKPLVDICNEHGTTLRIGVNHGSLSDRIMSRYGDTPAGMVESAMEFLRALDRLDFHRIVVSIKASNVVVMTETVRRMAEAMDAEGLNFPLHLGVTEAGDGEDGRVKSAVGIGSLLLQGLGDTIRVSLSEDPEAEIQPARAIVDHIEKVAGDSLSGINGDIAPGYDRFSPSRRESLWSDAEPKIAGLDFEFDGERFDISEDGGDKALSFMESHPETAVAISSHTPAGVLRLKAFMHRVLAFGLKNPVILSADYSGLSYDETAIAAAIDLGALLLDGFADGIEIVNSTLDTERLQSIALGILQATRLRFSKTEYISCPGCGRTLYNLQDTLHKIKAATSHLKGLKIGVMGCIVNGPGEMADADFGYVGAAAGKISLYKGKECVEKNIPQEDAIPHLIELIKSCGRWTDPTDNQ